MASLDASLIRSWPVLYVAVFDGDIVDRFHIKPDAVEYEVTRLRGDLLARAGAELVSLEVDNHIRRLVLQTSSHHFEVVMVENYRYRAYKTKTRTGETAVNFTM